MFNERDMLLRHKARRPVTAPIDLPDPTPDEVTRALKLEEKQRGMSVNKLAGALIRGLRISYRSADNLVSATACINPEWEERPGSVAIARQLTEKLKNQVGGLTFTVEVSFAQSIRATSEHTTEFYHNGTATVRLMSLP
ncbi:MAG: hypothetical protein ABIP50_02775 [Candidatus Saccharimonadales bacterium]